MSVPQCGLLRDSLGLNMPRAVADPETDAARGEAGRARCDGISQNLPDSTKCEGLTEAWRIAWMAYDHNIQWVPHGWNTAIGLAADLQLAAAMPVATYVEFLTPSPDRKSTRLNSSHSS